MKLVVTEELYDTVSVKDFDADKIYAFMSDDGDCFKLCQLPNDEYAFLNLNDTWQYWGDEGEAVELLTKYADDVDIYEFDNLNELIDWILS